MKKFTFITAALLVCLFVSNSMAAPSLYKQKKFFGPIPLNNFNIAVGFIDGPNADYLTEHLGFWAEQNGGEDFYDNISTAPYAAVGYERMVTPFHFLRVNVALAYLKTEGLGDVILAEPGPDLVAFDIERTFKTYYFSFDLGLGYYLVEPNVRALAPYVSGGFSGVVPMSKLETDAFLADGTSYDLAGENVEQTTFQAGLHIEFGMRYYLSNKHAAGMEGRYQMSQSKFKVHGGNFDIDHAGLSLSLNYYYHF